MEEKKKLRIFIKCFNNAIVFYYDGFFSLALKITHEVMEHLPDDGKKRSLTMRVAIQYTI